MYTSRKGTSPMNWRPEHRHPGDPEEQDVEAGHEARGRVEGLELRRVVGPAQGGERPEPGREPRVEHVGVLAERPVALRALGEVRRARRASLPSASQYQTGMPVAPPELARDAPVADVLHPVVVRLASTPRGTIRDAAVAHRLDRGLGQRLHADVPLLGDERLHHRLAAVADARPRAGTARCCSMRPRACMSSTMRLPGLEAVEPRVLAGALRSSCRRSR